MKKFLLIAFIGAIVALVGTSVDYEKSPPGKWHFSMYQDSLSDMSVEGDVLNIAHQVPAQTDFTLPEFIHSEFTLEVLPPIALEHRRWCERELEGSYKPKNPEMQRLALPPKLC